MTADYEYEQRGPVQIYHPKDRAARIYTPGQSPPSPPATVSRTLP
jgi:hypothetical protein